MARSFGSSNLKKAIIHILNASGGIKDEVPVKFFPSEYTLEKSNEFASINIPGLESPVLQFVRGGLGTLSMDLFFDSYEEGRDVREYTDKVTNLLKIDPELHAPPVLKFIWGDLNFTCVLTRASRKFTMFLNNGIPVRATLSVSFSQFMTESDLKASPTHSPDKTRAYTIKQGDNLWGIAAKMYGDPAFWRPIADKNAIENPRILNAGEISVIPHREK